MTAPPRLSPFDTVLHALMQPLVAVPPQTVPLAAALGRISAGAERAGQAVPDGPVARLDGWACASADLIGASVMAPVPLVPPAPWVEVGQPLPPGTDAVLAPDLVQRQGPMCLALAEALPGEAALRPGDWLGAGDPVVPGGQRIGHADLLLAEAAGLTAIACRIPRVRLVDTGAIGPTSRLIGAWLEAWGAQVERVAADGRPLTEAMTGGRADDLVVTIGGTGGGAQDKTASAIAMAGRLAVHGLALALAPTVAVGWLEAVPVVALPGAPEPAMVAALALLHPVVRRLAGASPALPLRLPLLRKIASSVGQAELVLLERRADGWMPLAVGQITPGHVRRADGWVVVPPLDEGWPVGALLDGWLMERPL